MNAYFASTEGGNDENKESPLQIVRGYNKDHKPECKEVVTARLWTETQLTLNGMTRP